MGGVHAWRTGRGAECCPSSRLSLRTLGKHLRRLCLLGQSMCRPARVARSAPWTEDARRVLPWSRTQAPVRPHGPSRLPCGTGTWSVDRHRCRPSGLPGGGKRTAWSGRPLLRWLLGASWNRHGGPCRPPWARASAGLFLRLARLGKKLGEGWQFWTLHPRDPHPAGQVLHPGQTGWRLEWG